MAGCVGHDSAPGVEAVDSVAAGDAAVVRNDAGAVAGGSSSVAVGAVWLLV